MDFLVLKRKLEIYLRNRLWKRNWVATYDITRNMTNLYTCYYNSLVSKFNAYYYCILSEEYINDNYSQLNFDYIENFYLFFLFVHLIPVLIERSLNVSDDK